MRPFCPRYENFKFLLPNYLSTSPKTLSDLSLHFIISLRILSRFKRLKLVLFRAFEVEILFLSGFMRYQVLKSSLSSKGAYRKPMASILSIQLSAELIFEKYTSRSTGVDHKLAEWCLWEAGLLRFGTELWYHKSYIRTKFWFYQP